MITHLIEALAELYFIGACIALFIALYLYVTAPEAPYDERD